ncbi:hypothetical protein WN51_07573 [Melipona quadrifasciata]|uniref:Uncharacterized protein n=1 Tax=Melipona quadrifasciata TaxID=166423 RepID=A0A0N0BJ77_9HYME|nr:hypothetical protein WN51_07573 [Melipona quadrifasciata]
MNLHRGSIITSSRLQAAIVCSKNLFAVCWGNVEEHRLVVYYYYYFFCIIPSLSSHNYEKRVIGETSVDINVKMNPQLLTSPSYTLLTHSEACSLEVNISSSFPMFLVRTVASDFSETNRTEKRRNYRAKGEAGGGTGTKEREKS